MPGRYKNGRTVGLWLNDDLVTRVDALASKAGISRSKLMANIIELNVKSLERADSVGILSMAILIRDLEEGLKGWVRQAKEEAHGIKEDWENNVYAEEKDDLAWNE
jgi:metal-responsive CopG/Arc/MetJ family transcriptional regulator